MFSPKVISHASSPIRRKSPIGGNKIEPSGKFIQRINKLNKLNGKSKSRDENKYSSLIKTIPKEKQDIHKMLVKFERETN